MQRDEDEIRSELETYLEGHFPRVGGLLGFLLGQSDTDPVRDV